MDGAGTTTYTYNALGDLTSVHQGDRPDRTFAYDQLRRLTSATNPESGTTLYRYDDGGNLIQKTAVRKAAGTTDVNTCYGGTLSNGVCSSTLKYDFVNYNKGYDGLNRMRSKSYDDGTPTYTYTYDAPFTITGHTGPNYPRGRLVRVAGGGSTTIYRYDAAGRFESSSQSAGSVYIFGYTYNAVGLQSITYPSGRIVSYHYDNGGRVDSVINGGSGSNYYANAVQYTPHQQIKSILLTPAQNQSQTFRYNSRLQMTNVAAAATGGQLGITNDYGANNNGNVISQTLVTPGLGQAVQQAYQYDTVNRLLSAGESGAWSQTYGYDGYGNRWVSTSTGLPTNSFTPTVSTNFDTLNRLQVQNTQYDGAGNLVVIGGYTFAYDGDDHLATSALSASTTTYGYDGLGRRVNRQTPQGRTIYVYDAFDQLAAEYTSEVLNPQACATCYVAQDHLGSTRLTTDASGGIVGCHDYVPFGEEIPSGVGGRGPCYATQDGTTQRFTGKERSETWEASLDYFGARYFSGAMGRFTGPDDPLVFAAPENPQSWNLYAYGFNNPLLYSDPDGHEPCINGVNPENGNICTVVTAPKPTEPPDMSWFTEMFLRSLVTTVQVAQQTQQVVQPLVDWISQPRNPWCLASAVGVGAGTGAVAGLAGGPGGLVTIPGGFVAGGLAGGGIGLSACMSNSGPTGGGAGAGGGGSLPNTPNPRDPNFRRLTVDQIKARYLKGGTELPGGYGNKTFAEVERLARQGDRSAITLRKLLTQREYWK